MQDAVSPGWQGANSRGFWSISSILGMLILLGLVLRLIHLGRASYWQDELFSVYYPQAGLHYMWTQGFSLETNPPLYYTLVWGWEHLFGTGEAVVRSLSVLFSVTTIPVVAASGTTLLDRRDGLVGAALFTVAPTAIAYSQDARGYTLYALAAAVILLGLARCLRNELSLGNLGIYIAGGAVSLYTHATATLLIAACNIVALYALFRAKRGERWREIGRWLLANLALALIALPEILAQLAEVSAGRMSVGPYISRYQVAAVFSELVAGPLAPLRFPGLPLALLTFAAIGIALWLRPVSREALLCLAVVPCLFFLLALVLTLGLHQLVLVARIFSWATVPLCLLMAHAVVTPKYQRAFAATLGVTLLVGLGIELSKAADPIEPWRTMLPMVEPQLLQADAVVLLPFTSAGAFRSYAPAVHNLRVLQSEEEHTSETEFMPKLFGVPTVTRDEVLTMIAHGARVWVVGQYDFAPELRRLLAAVPEPRRIEYRCPNQQVCFLAIQLS